LELSRLNTPSPYPLSSLEPYSETRLILRAPYQRGWYNYWKRLYIARFICTRTNLAVNPLPVTRPYSEDIADQEEIERRAAEEQEGVRRRVIRLERERREQERREREASERRLRRIRRRHRGTNTWVVTTDPNGRVVYTELDAVEHLPAPGQITWDVVTDNNGSTTYAILDNPNDQCNA
jgi:hypothetical protein